VEEEAVFFLLQKAAPQHQLRSAFERGSVRGWVYLETTMNEHMKYLLRLVPGIVHRQIGVAAEQIDFGDWTKMLTLRDSATHLEVGIWVWVCKGTYKGDVGYVSAVENWGGVSVLLVPRLAPPPLPGTSLAKRKRSRTPPNLNYSIPSTSSTPMAGTLFPSNKLMVVILVTGSDSNMDLL